MTNKPHYIDDQINLAFITDSRAPALMTELTGVDEFRVPPYIVPAEDINPNTMAAHAAIEARDKLSRLSTPLGRIMRFAVEQEAIDLSLDREALLEEVSREDITPQEFLLAFGLYTSLLRQSGKIEEAAKTAVTPIVHEGVRGDLVVLFGNAHRISSNMSEADSEIFTSELAQNLAPKYTDTSVIKRGRTGHPWNSAMYTARNATLDIVVNPSEVLDPATIMATRVLTTIVRNPAIRDDRLHELLPAYLKDPEAIVKNPELVFVLDQIKPTLTASQAEQMADNLVLSVLHRLRDQKHKDTYPGQLAKAYYAFADAEYDRTHHRRSISSKPSDGGKHNVAFTLSILATQVAKANGDPHRFRVTDYAKAFDYLLPEIKLETLWPELEPETAEVVAKAFSTIVHLTDSTER